jgi:hypothetical protein
MMRGGQGNIDKPNLTTSIVTVKIRVVCGMSAVNAMAVIDIAYDHQDR